MFRVLRLLYVNANVINVFIWIIQMLEYSANRGAFIYTV